MRPSIQLMVKDTNLLIDREREGVDLDLSVHVDVAIDIVKALCQYSDRRCRL